MYNFKFLMENGRLGRWWILNDQFLIFNGISLRYTPKPPKGICLTIDKYLSLSPKFKYNFGTC